MQYCYNDLSLKADIAQAVEHTHGKGEVKSASLFIGSNIDFSNK